MLLILIGAEGGLSHRDKKFEDYGFLIFVFRISFSEVNLSQGFLFCETNIVRPSSYAFKSLLGTINKGV